LLSVHDTHEEVSADPNPNARPFSLQCTKDGQLYFVTLDRVTKKVALEGIQPSRTIWPGEIHDAGDVRIVFSAGYPHAERYDLVWNSRERMLTLQGVPGNAARPTMIHACVEIEARSMLSLYDRL
jgi:hypothetical protein